MSVLSVHSSTHTVKASGVVLLNDSEFYQLGSKKGYRSVAIPLPPATRHQPPAGAAGEDQAPVFLAASDTVCSYAPKMTPPPLLN